MSKSQISSSLSYNLITKDAAFSTYNVIDQSILDDLLTLGYCNATVTFEKPNEFEEKALGPKYQSISHLEGLKLIEIFHHFNCKISINKILDHRNFLPSSLSHPLHFAAQLPQEIALQMLSLCGDEYYAPEKQVDGMGRTPLHYAALNENYAVIEMLKRKGIQDTQDDNGLSFIDYIQEKKFKSIYFKDIINTEKLDKSTPIQSEDLHSAAKIEPSTTSMNPDSVFPPLSLPEDPALSQIVVAPRDNSRG